MNPKTDAFTPTARPRVLAMLRLFRYLIGMLILLSGGAVLLSNFIAICLLPF